MRAVQAANADLVFVAAYPPDTVGIVRAAREINLSAKMFGGAMIGLLATPLKVQLGPAANNIVIMESFVPGFDFPGLKDFLAKYRDKAKGQQIDPFGYGFGPFGYAAGQILAQAVTATKGLDHDQIARGGYRGDRERDAFRRRHRGEPPTALDAARVRRRHPAREEGRGGGCREGTLLWLL